MSKEKEGTALILDGIHGLRGALDSLDRDLVAWSDLQVRRSLPGDTVDKFVDGLKRHRAWLVEQIECIETGRRQVLQQLRSLKRSNARG
jgi:hypothetical protein